MNRRYRWEDTADEQGTGQVFACGHVGVMAESFRRSLLVDKAKATVVVYIRPVQAFAEYLCREADPPALVCIRREHVERFLIALREREGIPNGKGTGQKLSAAYILKNYKGLKAFFDWAVDEGEIAHSPMEHVRPPKVPDKPVPVLTEEELRRLLRACEGRDFYSRRDTAIVRLLIDTGMRRGEIGGLRVGDIDFESGVAFVVGRDRGRGYVHSGGRLHRHSTVTCALGQISPVRA